MSKCYLCEEIHPHPRSMKATQEGWMVFEGTIESSEIKKKKTVLIFCPSHKDEEKWATILKEFPP